jgi:2'-5' RNA ligase
MNGIASLLNEPHKTQIESIWQELEEKCGLIGVRITPFPHLTYQVVEAYDQMRLDPIIREITRQARPFMIHSTGLGVFTGETPVIYLPLVKDETLLLFHKLLWERTKDAGRDASPYYAPEMWMPHITLGYGDVTNFNLGCAMEALAFRNLGWQMVVDNLTFIGQVDENIYESCCIYRFGE